MTKDLTLCRTWRETMDSKEVFCYPRKGDFDGPGSRHVLRVLGGGAHRAPDHCMSYKGNRETERTSKCGLSRWSTLCSGGLSGSYGKLGIEEGLIFQRRRATFAASAKLPATVPAGGTSKDRHQPPTGRLASPRPNTKRPSMAEPVLNASEAAKYLGVCRKTMSDWLAAGRIRHAKIGTRLIRIRVADLDEFLKANEVAPVKPAKTSRSSK